LPNRTSTGLARTPDFCASLSIAVDRAAARTVKRPEPFAVRGVFQLTGSSGCCRRSRATHRTPTELAPWTLVEAENKRFARVKVLRTIADRLDAALDG
jgi:hypothetical protein